jgi:hypothetical protein
MAAVAKSQAAAEKAIAELAAEEGHDGDIPSNLGRAIGHKSLLEKGGEPDLEMDLEKGGLSTDASSVERVEGTVSAHPSRPEATKDENPEDPNIVWWDGPNDPQNPMNWSKARRWGAIYIVSAITFLTPLGTVAYERTVKCSKTR